MRIFDEIIEYVEKTKDGAIQKLLKEGWSIDEIIDNCMGLDLPLPKTEMVIKYAI